MGTEKLPDLIVVMTDQQRADLSKREGFSEDTTPFLDQLAADGIWFDRAYCAAPSCVPARTSFLTGRYPSAHRVRTNAPPRTPVTDDDLFASARAAGYATALIGKNHTWLSSDDVDCIVEFSHVGQMGNEKTSEETEYDSWLRSLKHSTSAQPSPFPLSTQLPVRIVRHALEWIESVPADQPLLLWLSVPEPHSPYQAPEPYFSMFDDAPAPLTDASALETKSFAWRYLHTLAAASQTDYQELLPAARSNYLGMLRLIDEQLEHFYSGLSQLRASRPRMSVVTSDHGDFVGEYGLMRKGAEIPEVLARIPILFEGDQIAGSDGNAPHTAHVSAADIFPTFLEAFGAELPRGNQGRSLLPLLTGQAYPAAEFTSAYVEQGVGGVQLGPDDIGAEMPGLTVDGPPWAGHFGELNDVTESGRRRMVRSDDWKLIVDQEGNMELYNLVQDPAEIDNRWSKTGLDAVRIDLLHKLAIWQMRVEDPLTDATKAPLPKQHPRNYLVPDTSSD